VLVSLVQTADALPAVLFALVAGVLADIFDRVKLLLAVLAGLTVAGGTLTALTAVHRMPPALLLMFTFVLGTGGILAEPAYQSLVPDMVPRPQVPAASALGSISINLARAIRPEHGDVRALCGRAGLPSPAGRDSAVSRAVHPRAACGPAAGTRSTHQSCSASCCERPCSWSRPARSGPCCP
jgi:hypothetical protein